jgi:hypothetical protein
MEVVALRVPEVPVMVTVAGPALPVALAVSVRTVVEVVGLVANAPVTPVGKPDAARVTLPVNGLTSVTVIVSVPPLPCITDRVGAEVLRVNPPGVVTVRAIVVVSVRAPEVPVIVTVAGPVVAVALAVSVRTLVEVVGLVPNTAVTPLGRPDAASVTLPVNPFTPATLIVSVALVPWTIDNADGDADRVKPGWVTVRPIVEVAVNAPLVPVIVTVLVPGVATAEAANVSVVLDPVVEAGVKVAVTPAGIPLAVKATAPVKPPAGVIVSMLELLAL